MPYDLRTIAYNVEFLHPPLAHSVQALQHLHNDLFTNSACAYVNFAVAPGGATLSNPAHAPGQVHSSAFLPDRVQIRDEMGGATLDEFCARTEGVLQATFKHLSMPVLTGQQVVVRSLLNPHAYRDAREFLARGVVHLDPGLLQPFGREANLFGLRFAFPQTPENPNLLQVRIESYTADPRSVFLENTAMFPVIVTAQNVSVASQNVRSVYEFLHDRMTSFLESFDHPSEP